MDDLKQKLRDMELGQSIDFGTTKIERIDNGWLRNGVYPFWAIEALFVVLEEKGELEGLVQHLAQD